MLDRKIRCGMIMSFYAIRIEIIIVDKKLLKMIKNKTNENLMEIITNYIYIYLMIRFMIRDMLEQFEYLENYCG